MAMLKKKLSSAIAASFCIPMVTALAGCGSVQPAKEADANILADRDTLQQQVLQGSTMSTRPSAVSTIDDIYYAGKPFKLSERQFLPPMFAQQFIFNQMQPITLQELLSLVSTESGYRVTLTADALDFLGGKRSGGNDNSNDGGGPPDGGADMAGAEGEGAPFEQSVFDQIDAAGSGVSATNIRFTFNHQGTLSSLFDRVTAKSDLFWEFRDNQIFVFRTKTKTFTLDMLPTETVVSSSMTTKRNSTDSGGGKSQTGQSMETTYDSGEVYPQVESALKGMLSGSGVITINRSFGSVMIRDTPRVLEEVARYITELNRVANRNISVRVQVYEVSVAKTSDFSVDINAIFSGSSRVGAALGSSYASATGATGGIVASVVNPDSRFAGSVAEMRAEGRDINLSTLTDHFTVTKNGMPAPIQLVNEKDYLQKTSRSTDGEGNVSVELTPGTALEGITMNVVPRILSDGSVDCLVTLDMSKVNSINELTVGEGDNQSSIQLTDIDSRSLSRTLNIKNGKTLMMAGLARTERNGNTAGMFGSKLWALGGEKAGGERQIINVILLTPYIMER